MKRYIGLTVVLSCMSGACAAETGMEDLGSQSQAIAGGGVALAVFQASTSDWFIDANDNGVWENGVDTKLDDTFGGPGDVALSGYGSVGSCGNGGGRIGVWRPSDRKFYLDTNGDKVWTTGVDRTIQNLKSAVAGFTDQAFIYSVVTSGGEFPQCKGVVGYFRTPNAGGAGNWFIDFNDNGVIGAGEGPFQWGQKGDIAVPVAKSSEASRLTIFRTTTGEWIRDTNGNKSWEGCGVDLCATFGSPGEKPFAHPNGRWIGTASGATKFVDLNANFAWDAGDGTFTFGVAAAQPLML